MKKDVRLQKHVDGPKAEEALRNSQSVDANADEYADESGCQAVIEALDTGGRVGGDHAHSEDGEAKSGEKKRSQRSFGSSVEIVAQSHHGNATRNRCDETAKPVLAIIIEAGYRRNVADASAENEYSDAHVITDRQTFVDPFQHASIPMKTSRHQEADATTDTINVDGVVFASEPDQVVDFDHQVRHAGEQMSDRIECFRMQTQKSTRTQ